MGKIAMKENMKNVVDNFNFVPEYYCIIVRNKKKTGWSINANAKGLAVMLAEMMYGVPEFKNLPELINNVVNQKNQKS